MASLPKVAVAMSGGVDSSVAAALLVEQGYPVIGLMLRLWSEPGRDENNRCCTPDAMANARRVAGILGIPFYAIDVRDKFKDSIVQYFLKGYAAGITPNPCIECNRLIRWGVMLEHALSLGAEKMATGHYARLTTTASGLIELRCGMDETKDQAYVLSRLTQDQLHKTLLPLGELLKVQVRELAKKFNLPVAERPDSQDLCFLAGEDYRTFLLRQDQSIGKPGLIKNRKGIVLGQHQGLPFYTIGQRKGLLVTSPEPLYVLAKEHNNNELIVGTLSELGQSEMQIQEINWISGFPPELPADVAVKIRYQAEKAPAKVAWRDEKSLTVLFETPRRDITPGQLAVIYDGDLVSGSGMIT